MIYDIYFVIGLRTKEGSFSPYIALHPFMVIFDVSLENDKVFFFNLTSADHYNESLNYIYDLKYDVPLLVKANKYDHTSYPMYIVGDCSVVSKKDISTKFCVNNEKTIIFLQKYKCKNYKELKKEILKAIYENPFSIVTYDGKTGKIIENDLNQNLLVEIENSLFED